MQNDGKFDFATAKRIFRRVQVHCTCRGPAATLGCPQDKSPPQDKNQNHRLSRWYALRLKGEITGCPTRALNRTCQSHWLHGLPLKQSVKFFLLLKAIYRCEQITLCRNLFYVLLFLLPVNGSTNSLKVICSYAKSSSSWWRIYSSIAFLLRPTVST